jgi:hypothetical protein
LFCNKQTRDKWAFFCMLASGCLPENVGTATERALNSGSFGPGTAAGADGGVGSPSSRRAGHALDSDVPSPFVFTPELLEPLTTLPAVELEQAALALWKNVVLYSSVLVKQSALGYHIAMVQNIVNQVRQQFRA